MSKLVNTNHNFYSEGDQPWDFFGRNDAKAETPILWPPSNLHAKGWLNGKDSDAGRDWGQEEKGTTEDEMAGWHHWLDGRESEWTLGVGEEQGGLACCNSWGCKVGHDWATELNWRYTHTISVYIGGWGNWLLWAQRTGNTLCLNLGVITGIHIWGNSSSVHFTVYPTKIGVCILRAIRNHSKALSSDIMLSGVHL